MLDALAFTLTCNTRAYRLVEKEVEALGNTSLR